MSPAVLALVPASVPQQAQILGGGSSGLTSLAKPIIVDRSLVAIFMNSRLSEHNHRCHLGRQQGLCAVIQSASYAPEHAVSWMFGRVYSLIFRCLDGGQGVFHT